MTTKTETQSPKGLMRVTVQIGDRRFDEDLSAQLFIAPDMVGIDKALETGAARQAEWAMLAAFAKTEHDLIKSNLAALEAEIYLEMQTSPPMGIKPTVDAVKALVETNPRRVAMNKLLLEAADKLRVLEVGKYAMADRKDYVIERARNMRQEMQSKMNVPVPAGESLDRFRPGGR